MVAWTTASSSATLPVSKEVMEVNEKADKDVTGFVLPFGATLNMDGSALYQSLVVLFLATISGINLEIYQQGIVFVLIMFSSAGSAGIPGGGMAVMAMALEILGIPLELMGIYVLVDRFWDYIITAVYLAPETMGTYLFVRMIIPSRLVVRLMPLLALQAGWMR